MDKCTKERIKIASLRSLVALGAGAAVYFLAGWLTQKYGVDYATQIQLGLTLAASVGTWFASKPAFSFSEECMLMEEAKTRRPKIADSRKVYLPQARVAAATAKIKTDKKPEKPAPTATLAAGKLAQGRVTIEVTRPEGGSPLVTVTASVSGSEFKGNNGNGGLRQRLEGISGIKWENPKNANGQRTMAGVVKSSNESDVASKLAEVASRYNR